MDSTTKPLKPKLPRKRKKAAVKAQGLKWYYDTMTLFYKTYGTPYGEKRCKFWVNSSIRHVPVVINGNVMMVMRPARFW